ncbi:MAG: methionine--tRNA ligase [Bacteroidia bacterium]|nr:methionine--tRNA ligase [Bacteroidia bacterium]MDW8016072.1 methionine--tRNA ligase [Bacteroidia bacterium]
MPYLVTAALPYANGPLHIGHIAGAYLPADIFARYLRLKGEEVLYICGSDEHGVAITLRALQEQTSPQAIIDKYHPLLKESLSGMGIRIDYYGRTSDPLHHATAQHFFLRLLEKGWLEKRVVEQFWDPQAETFLPDRYIAGTCPHCGYEEAYGDQCERCGALLSPTELIHPRSRLTGAAPILRPSEQYYFRLDLLQPFVEEYIHQRQWKPNVGPVVEQWLKTGLAARAITRDLSWGIPLPLPDLQGKVLYVWFEAPLGYISITQKWAAQTGDPTRWEHFWKNPDAHIVHFIGKDNIVFHTLIFPAILIAADEGYTLPTAVPANEFLTLEGQKLSTSRRWTVDIHKYLQVAPHRVDELRFVLTALMPQTRDRDFSWEEFATRINNELIATLTNLIHRLLTLIWRQGGEVPVTPTEALLEARITAARHIGKRIEDYDFTGALEEVLQLARRANKLLTEQSPWHRSPEEAQSIVASYGDILAAFGTLLEPFLPVTIAPTLRSQLGIDTFPWQRLCEPQVLVDQLKLKAPPTPLVQKLTSQELQMMREKLLPLPPSVPPAQEFISLEEFQKVRLQVVTIRAAERIPKADKLLKLTIEAADGLHVVVSGIAEHYQPEQLVGQQALWVSNLAPRTLRGIQSEGMLLFAEGEGGRLVRVSPETSVPPGSPVR